MLQGVLYLHEELCFFNRFFGNGLCFFCCHELCFLICKVLFASFLFVQGVLFVLLANSFFF